MWLEEEAGPLVPRSDAPFRRLEPPHHRTSKLHDTLTGLASNSLHKHQINECTLNRYHQEMHNRKEHVIAD